MYKNNDEDIYPKCNDGDEDGDHGDEDEDEPGELLPSLRRTRDKLLRLPAWDLMMMMMTVSCHLNYFVAFLKHCHSCSISSKENSLKAEFEEKNNFLNVDGQGASG